MTDDEHYFAYGSNMLRERLVARCATAGQVTLAALPHHRLVFDKKSSDGSGKCSFEPAPTECVHGVLWRLDGRDRAKLDRYEGVGQGYAAEAVRVVDAAGKVTAAVTYRAVTRQAGLPIYDWYWALVVAGALQHGLPKTYLAWLRQVTRVPDPIPDRETRLDALGALRKSGYDELLNG